MYPLFSFTYHGPKFNEGVNLRAYTALPQDKATAVSSESVKNEYTYLGDITGTYREGKERWIDGIIKVEGVSIALRTRMLNLWEGLRNKELAIGTVVVILGVAGGVAAGTAIEATAAIALGTLAALCAATAVLVFYRAYQANQAHHEWIDPMPSYIEARKRCGTEGFSYLYQNQCKGQVVSENETKAIWFDTMAQWQSKLNAINNVTSSQAKFVKEFFTHNPIGSACVSYAFGAANLDDPRNSITLDRTALDAISGQFGIFKQKYDHLVACFREQRQNINTKADRAINSNEWKRSQSLQPFRTIRDSMINQARATRDQKLLTETHHTRHEPQSHRRPQPAQRVTPHHSAAEADYRRTVAMYNSFYNLATAPINSHYDRIHDDIQKQRNTALAELKTQEDHSLSNLLSAVRSIMNAFANCKEANNGYQPIYPNIAEIQGFVFPEPSAPPMEAEPQFDPNLCREGTQNEFHAYWQQASGAVV